MGVAELQPGERLGPTVDGLYRYEVREVLGAGGFGITYLGRDARLDGDVVIKELACASVSYRDTQSGVMRPSVGQGELHDKLVARFVREAQLLNRLRSPHIVRVTDVWEERGTAYYAMDKVDATRHLGEPHADGVTTTTWRQVETHARQLLAALQAVHDAGLVHGDVKPANVLVDRKNGVVLIDFGTARADSEVDQTVTSTSFTRGYAPPELMHPSRVREAGPWSDLYSWGMVLWGLVLAHPGDLGRPLDAVARQHSFDPYVDAAGQLQAAGVPAPWAHAVEQCLRLDPVARPGSVAAVLALVGDARAGVVSGASSTPASRASASAKAAPTALLAEGVHPVPRPRASDAGANDAPARAAAPAAPQGPRAVGFRLAAAAALVSVALGAAVAVAWSRSQSVAPQGSAALDTAPTQPVASVGTSPPVSGPDEPPDPAEGSAQAAAWRPTPCVTAACTNAVSAHRALIDAVNDADVDALLARYAERLRCHYSEPDKPRDSIGETRRAQIAGGNTNRIDIETAAAVTVAALPGETVVVERSRVVSESGRSKPQERVFVFAHGGEGSDPVVVVEAGAASHACARELFPSAGGSEPQTSDRKAP